MKQAAIFPGTFDPPTKGHYDIIERAAKLFPILYIAIGENSSKNPAAFTIEERIEMLNKLTKNLQGVHIVRFDGLLVHFAKERGVGIIVRSIRNLIDLEYDVQQAQMNRLMEDLETIYLYADEKYRMISSTLVREIGKKGGRLTPFVPSEIEEFVFSKLSTIKQL